METVPHHLQNVELDAFLCDPKKYIDACSPSRTILNITEQGRTKHIILPSVDDQKTESKETYGVTDRDAHESQSGILYDCTIHKQGFTNLQVLEVPGFLRDAIKNADIVFEPEQSDKPWE